MQKLRMSLVYLNARRYGLTEETSYKCAINWNRFSTTLFSQEVADMVCERTKMNFVNFAPIHNKKIMYITAHFSAYSLIPIALARHFRKTVNVIVGTPPNEFSEAMINSFGRAGVTAKVIRSDFSLLRNIQKAINDGGLVFSLIDVPWHRTSAHTHAPRCLKFGAGEIMTYGAIFNLASRLDLQPNLVLCEPALDGFNIIDYGQLSETACFQVLDIAVRNNPDHFERFCELHRYYKSEITPRNLVTFLIGSHRYCIQGEDRRSWRLNKNLTEEIEKQISNGVDESEISILINSEIMRVAERSYDEIVYI